MQSAWWVDERTQVRNRYADIYTNVDFKKSKAKHYIKFFFSQLLELLTVQSGLK